MKEIICINKEGDATILNQDIRLSIIKKKFGMLIRTVDEYLFCKEYGLLSYSFVENPEYKDKSPETSIWVDEPYSTPETWKPIWSKYKDTVFGELTFKAFRKLTGLLSYAAYCLIWNIGFRFHVPWTTQISTWKKMQSEFGDRFTVCCIKLGQRKWEECRDWAIKNDKDILFYTEEENPETLKQFIEAL